MLMDALGCRDEHAMGMPWNAQGCPGMFHGCPGLLMAAHGRAAPGLAAPERPAISTSSRKLMETTPFVAQTVAVETPAQSPRTRSG